MQSASRVPRLDLALIAHEISDQLQQLLDQYGGKLVLHRERKACTLQIQFDDENDTAMTLITAAKAGSYTFVAVGKEAKQDALPEAVDPALWARWCEHRIEIKKPLTNRSRRAQLAMLAEMSHGQQRACIEQSIRNGWVGLFPAKTMQAVGRARSMTDLFVGGGRD